MTVYFGGEESIGQTEVAEYLLGGRDFVRLVVDLGMREHDDRFRSEGSLQIDTAILFKVVAPQNAVGAMRGANALKRSQ